MIYNPVYIFIFLIIALNICILLQKPNKPSRLNITFLITEYLAYIFLGFLLILLKIILFFDVGNKMKNNDKIACCNMTKCDGGSTWKKCYRKSQLIGDYRHPDRGGNTEMNQKLTNCNEIFDDNELC